MKGALDAGLVAGQAIQFLLEFFVVHEVLVSRKTDYGRNLIERFRMRYASRAGVFTPSVIRPTVRVRV